MLRQIFHRHRSRAGRIQSIWEVLRSVPPARRRGMACVALPVGRLVFGVEKKKHKPTPPFGATKKPLGHLLLKQRFLFKKKKHHVVKETWWKKWVHFPLFCSGFQPLIQLFFLFFKATQFFWGEIDSQAQTVGLQADLWVAHCGWDPQI